MNEVRIVIGQRGWVWVGFYKETEREIVLTKAKCILRWGTTAGLGQLVSGPLSETKLNEAGTVRIHPLAVVATYDCNSEKWSHVLV